MSNEKLDWMKTMMRLIDKEQTSEGDTPIAGGSFEDEELSGDVVLVAMPFASLNKPSLGLGCLAGALRRAGISTRSLYFTLDFAEAIGLRNYFNLTNVSNICEWAFSRAAFPDMERDDEGFFRVCGNPLICEMLLKARDAADSYVDRCVAQVLALNPKIVGCSLSYFQTCASLALLRRIREAAPGVATVIGGSSCEGVMGGELHRSFPWIDYVFSGDADESFPDFCRAFLSGETGEKIGGGAVGAAITGAADSGWNRPEVLTPHDRRSGREPGTGRGPGRGTVADLSSLPFPFFDDYFEALGKSDLQDYIIPGLVLETSRGCWWGAENPCPFCGFNGLYRKQRSKSPDRAYREITELAERHGVKGIHMADNMIHPLHIEQLLPRFEGGAVNFMYETPATLSREQMRKLSDAGVRRIQPGIEHLHDEALAALGKPNRVFHNIRILKWAREYGMEVAWNFLYGFAGEKDAWHGEAADLMPL
ncbi:MAG: RiPP maturation radical SAM C-methyltransferase, partial [Synergistaceae bacterium]|nr:RiPP maturation radical SAM C-methyltransferase [Synergistaceae bacterium]